MHTVAYDTAIACGLQQLALHSILNIRYIPYYLDYVSIRFCCLFLRCDFGEFHVDAPSPFGSDTFSFQIMISQQAIRMAHELLIRPSPSSAWLQRPGIRGREGWGGHMTQSLWDIIERFVFDPSFVDLVVWFPHLSWHEFAASTATVVVYKFISQQIEKIATFHARRLVSWWLLRLALMVRPS
jgi:hypothetical protein